MISRFIQTNGITLHVMEDGPATGPLVILLHGFPECWYGWQAQIPALAAVGYRVWVPVVGHDWGAVVAWWLAATYPERLNKLVCMNVPHYAIMLRFLRKSPRQLLRSWYTAFFQIPWLPEWLSRLGGYWGLIRSLRQSSRPGTFSDYDITAYRTAWSQPGPTGVPALRTMINWYRALAQHCPPLPANERITVPALLIWGVKDDFLIPDLAQPSIDLCDNGKLVFFPNATHWIQHEEANAVNALLSAV